jgi:hypothetical protein
LASRQNDDVKQTTATADPYGMTNKKSNGNNNYP